MSQSLTSLVNSYLDNLQQNGKADKTIENYAHYLAGFVGYAGHKDSATITRDDIYAYRRLIAEGSFSLSTQTYHMIALRGFLRFCKRRGINMPDADIIELPKQIRPLMPVLDTDELVRLFNAPNIDTSVGLRDRAILELLFGSGMRVSELTNLNRGDIPPSKREFTIRGKGQVLRMVFVTDRAGSWLARYLATRDDNTTALFTELASGTNHRLTDRSIQRAIKKYAAKADIAKDITPHTMRHSFATFLLDQGADIRAVQELLGHASILTTQFYTHVTNNKLKEVHAKYLNLEETI